MTSSRSLLVIISSFLASSACTNAFQVNPAQASPPPTTSLGYTAGPDVIAETAWQQPAPPAPQAPNRQHQLPNMRSVSTRAEFQQHVEDSSKLTVVRFHAPFCKACKAMAPQLERFAKTHPEINFVQVAYDRRDPEIKGLVQELHINKVPYGQVYHPQAGLVESANFNKRYFGGVQRMVEEYEQGSCELPADVDEYSNVYEAPYAIMH